MGGDRLWTLERQTGPECSQTITITRSGGPVLTSCRREDSQWKERAHRMWTSRGVDYKLDNAIRSFKFSFAAVGLSDWG